MDEQTENQKKMEFLNTLTLNGYNNIIETSRQLDQKTHNIIAQTSIMLPILLGLFYYLGKTADWLGMFSYAVVFITIGITLFILAFVKGCLTYKPLPYKALDPYKFASTHVHESLQDIMNVTVSTLGDITSQNWDMVRQKASSCESSLRFVTAGATMFGLGFLLLTLGLVYPHFVRLLSEIWRFVSALSTCFFLQL